ncbi:MAG: sulfatase-like hydrolase/transferase [Fuerstiella sp.]|nr:sulfatase-like hydrolase/transferase [Fuerstiella sp.]MCP4856864.1 sulfatase-like hydrolase/transferase [Fuerstiella sp.]
MHRRIRLIIPGILIFTGAAFWASYANAADGQPNILIIQADDLGYDDLSINGNTRSRTPNIDRLAESSVRFSNFMVNSVCSPTRGSLLTGRDYPTRNKTATVMIRPSATMCDGGLIKRMVRIADQKLPETDSN